MHWHHLRVSAVYHDRLYTACVWNKRHCVTLSLTDCGRFECSTRVSRLEPNSFTCHVHVLSRDARTNMHRVAVYTETSHHHMIGRYHCYGIHGASVKFVFNLDNAGISMGRTIGHTMLRASSCHLLGSRACAYTAQAVVWNTLLQSEQYSLAYHKYRTSLNRVAIRSVEMHTGSRATPFCLRIQN
jgi:hypothetical protein